jgi:hypothetical protein
LWDGPRVNCTDGNPLFGLASTSVEATLSGSNLQNLI